MTSTVTYLGNLRTSATHVASKNEFITDAPVDNQGKGEAFAPTDTVATALASCLLTIMGIKARDLDVDLAGTTSKVTKVMALNPRRIAEIMVDVVLSKSLDAKTRILLERAALSCPVSHSLHPDLNQNISFTWPS
ncbi:MAG: OsmC family protein [Flavobacteriaceae bacterium]